jgi:hypothetical protein
VSTLFEAVARMPRAELRSAYEGGDAPDLDALVGYEFRGFNTGALPKRLGIQKFIKGFFRDGAAVEGYNLPVQQNGLDGPWLPRASEQPPRRFGFFMVDRVRAGTPEAARAPEGAVMLDYGASARNPWWRPERLLRDCLVVPDRGEPDVLLGRAFLAVAGQRLHAAYFVIERYRAVE